MSHDALLFNIHDLILLIAIAQYLLLATLLVLTRRPEECSGYWLAAILAVAALQAMDTLMVWSPTLRHMLLESHPNLFFLATISYWLEGPLMYWYVASVLYWGGTAYGNGTSGTSCRCSPWAVCSCGATICCR
jgi:hypothetical protein